MSSLDGYKFFIGEKFEQRTVPKCVYAKTFFYMFVVGEITPITTILCMLQCSASCVSSVTSGADTRQTNRQCSLVVTVGMASVCCSSLCTWKRPLRFQSHAMHIAKSALRIMAPVCCMFQEFRDLRAIVTSYCSPCRSHLLLGTGSAAGICQGPPELKRHFYQSLSTASRVPIFLA